MQTATPRILVVNPGSTSTKLSVHQGTRSLLEATLNHDATALRRFGNVARQQTFREEAITTVLRQNNLTIGDFDLVIGRGGLLRPLKGGVYRVGPAMLDDLANARFGEHASNLGALIAHRFATEGKLEHPAYTANPVVVDELDDIARITGHPDITRRSIFHALNHKAVAALVARRLKKPYNKCRFVVAHIGGGISVGAHRNGRVVDVNDALEGDGAFSPERTGSLPLIPFYRWAIEQNLTTAQATAFITRSGGLLAHLGTNDCREIVARIQQGDKHAELILTAFIQQLAKMIGASATVLDGRLDAVILTGNVMKSDWIRRRLLRKISYLAPHFVMTGQSEMDALATAAFSVWQGSARALDY